MLPSLGAGVLGIGYATPYLGVFLEEAVRVLAFMPAQQGVVNWPSSGYSASALVEATAMPLPDSSIDRAILIHGLEITEHPRDLLAEIWRILTPDAAPGDYFIPTRTAYGRPAIAYA